MILRRFSAGNFAVALGAAGLFLSPAIAAGESKKRPPAVSLSVSPDFGFTPASADPRLAAAYSGRVSGLGDFKFTPAAAKGRPSQVRVAIRARATSPQQVAAANSSASPVSALAPVSYNLGVAVGWRRFAVSGDVSKGQAQGSPIDGREGATVGEIDGEQATEQTIMQAAIKGGAS